MNADYVQNLRYKLQKRVRRLNSTDHQLYHAVLQQLWRFINSHPVFVGVLDDLDAQVPNARETAVAIVKQHEELCFSDETTGAAVSSRVLKMCAESDDAFIEITAGQVYSTESTHAEMVSSFHSVFVEPFYEYLDEQLDDQRAALALLRRYKHKCEWFQREPLHIKATENTGRGEKELALHLYEYLYDQGLEFSIEPWSVSGEADIVASQNRQDPFVADVKVFDPCKNKGKDYIARGFNQLYIYTRDYNEPFGYLVVFNISEYDLKFTMPTQEQATQLLTHNGKTIFLLTIDIHPYSESASRRGKLQTIEVTAEDLVSCVQEERAATKAPFGIEDSRDATRS